MNENKKERITIEISAELKKKVLVYCAENGIKSVKEFITRLIEETIINGNKTIKKGTAKTIFDKGNEYYILSSDKGFNFSRFLDWLLFEFELAKVQDAGIVIYDKEYFKNK